MELKKLDYDLTVCKVVSIVDIDLNNCGSSPRTLSLKVS